MLILTAKETKQPMLFDPKENLLLHADSKYPLADFEPLLNVK